MLCWLEYEQDFKQGVEESGDCSEAEGKKPDLCMQWGKGVSEECWGDRREIDAGLVRKQQNQNLANIFAIFFFTMCYGGVGVTQRQ